LYWFDTGLVAGVPKSKGRVRLLDCIPSAYFLHTFIRICIYLDTKTRESARRRATPRVEQSAFVLIVLFFFSVWEYNNFHIRNDGRER
jgi:hypothetical protein